MLKSINQESVYLTRFIRSSGGKATLHAALTALPPAQWGLKGRKKNLALFNWQYYVVCSVPVPHVPQTIPNSKSSGLQALPQVNPPGFLQLRVLPLVSGPPTTSVSCLALFSHGWPQDIVRWRNLLHPLSPDDVVSCQLLLSEARTTSFHSFAANLEGALIAETQWDAPCCSWAPLHTSGEYQMCPVSGAFF